MKKGYLSITIAILIIWLVFWSFLFVITLIVENQEQNRCENLCKGAIDVESNSEGSFGGWLSGNVNTICKCYYSDKVETKKLKNG